MCANRKSESLLGESLLGLNAVGVVSMMCVLIVGRATGLQRPEIGAA